MASRVNRAPTSATRSAPFVTTTNWITTRIRKITAPNGAIRLFVLDAAIYLPDYSPEISDEHCLAIDLHTAEDALVLVVANPGETGTRMNLLAPIVVNVHTGACARVILDDQDWPLQAELAVRSA